MKNETEFKQGYGKKIPVIFSTQRRAHKANLAPSPFPNCLRHQTVSSDILILRSKGATLQIHKFLLLFCKPLHCEVVVHLTRQKAYYGIPPNRLILNQNIVQSMLCKLANISILWIFAENSSIWKKKSDSLEAH